MKIERADASHSDEINAFLATHVLHGDFNFSIERNSGYFDKLKLTSDEYETYFIRNARGKISACASLVFENSFIEGELKKICWLIDLRIGPDRKSSLFWIRHFFSLMFDRAQAHEADHIFSIVFKDAKHNLTSLIRPRKRHAHIPQFLHMKNFQMLSIHGKLPSLQNILSSIKIRPLNTNSLEELSLYLKSKSQNRLLGTDYTPELLLERLEKWPGFRKENFFVCTDKRKNIVGCYALWDGSPIQKLKLLDHGPHSRNFFYITKLLSLFGLARPMVGPGQSLDFYHMTHLYCDNSDIFELILHHAFFRTKKKYLVYPQFEDHIIQLPPKQFLHQNLDFALYTILPHGKAPSDKLRQNPFADPPDLGLWGI